tara:strand:+ start:3030 stop:3329 length:300 start_codon:yes stop_codon:yes gene_type:complete
MSVNRYLHTEKKKGDVYATTRYPKFEKSPTDLYIVSRDKDRLDLLSNEFYKDPRYWWIIAQANPTLGKGSFDIPPGIQLRIPFPLVDVGIKLQTVQLEK